MTVRMIAFAVSTVRAAVFAAFVRRRSNLALSAAPRAVMGMAGMVVQRLNGGRCQQVTGNRADDQNPFGATHHANVRLHRRQRW
jgi:hypothetical protein